MVEKIKYEEKLRQGTDKLNQSIEQSNVASQKAITAEQTANQAIQQSESTQTQLDNIVIEGDSSVEAAQARVDSKGESFPTLKSRLDNFEVSATQQLQQIEKKGKDIKTFGAIGDGITDDTVAIQSALDSGEVIYWSNGTYYFKNVLITKDNTNLIFANNVRLKSDYAVDTTDAWSFGILGSSSSSTTILNSIAANDTEILVKDSSSFKVGDLVKIDQTDPTGTTEELKKQKYCVSMCKVRNIDSVNNKIHLSQPIAHDYQLSNIPKITKIVPAKNIYIDFNGAVFDKMGTTTYTNHIAIRYAENITINNLEVIYGGGKGITISESFNFQLNNIKSSMPTNITAGHGYGVQARLGASYGEFNNIIAYDNRHGVDISSGANNIVVNNYKGHSSEVLTHGGNSKKIIFNNCEVYNSGFTMGNQSFGGDYGIKLINCKVYNAPDIAYVTTNGTSDVVFEGCYVIGGRNGFVINDNSYDIIIINPQIQGVTSTAISSRGSRVRITDVQIREARYSGLSIFGGSNTTINNISITNDSTYEQNNGITVEGTSTAITINQIKIRGKYNRPIKSSGTSGLINILLSDIVAEAPRLIDIQSTRLDNEVLVEGAVRMENTSQTSNNGIYAGVNSNGISIKNSIINSSMVLQSSKNVKVIDNDFKSGALTINATADVLVANNYGKPEEKIIPTDNGTHVRISNNIWTA